MNIHFFAFFVLASIAMVSAHEGHCSQDGSVCVEEGVDLSTKMTQLEMYKTVLEIREKQADPARFQFIDERKDEADLTRDAMWSILQAEKVNHWRGIPFRKGAQEMAMYPQLMHELNPRTIIEVGTYAGGSAVWFADTADSVLGGGVPVLTVDLDYRNLHPTAQMHHNVRSYICDVTNYESCVDFRAALRERALERPWLVSEDAHFGLEGQLEWWHTQLAVGDYLIVEDTSVDQNAWVAHIHADKEYVPVDLKLGIVRRFLEAHPKQYAIDTYYNDMYGYNSMKEWNSILKRVA